MKKLFKSWPRFANKEVNDWVLSYLVTSCDYTISNNNLALDMESAIIPFCGRIKKCPARRLCVYDVLYHISILQEILLTYLWESSIWAIFFKPYCLGGNRHTKIQNIRTALYFCYSFEISPVTKIVWSCRAWCIIF